METKVKHNEKIKIMNEKHVEEKVLMLVYDYFLISFIFHVIFKKRIVH